VARARTRMSKPPRTPRRPLERTPGPDPHVRAAQVQIGSVTATLSPARALLIFNEPVTQKQLDVFLTRYRLVLDDAYASGRRVNSTPRHSWVRTADGGLLALRLRPILANKLIDTVVPVYQRADVPGPGGLVAPLPHLLTVPLSPLHPLDITKLKPRLARLRVRLRLPPAGQRGGFATLTMPDSRENASFVLAPQITELLGGIAPCHDWAPLLSPQAMATATHPNDQRYDDSIGDEETTGTQWNMRRIGAPYAWDPVAGAGTGSGSVTLYLFDKGVQLDHPDLPTYSTTIAAGRMTQFGFKKLSNYPDFTGVDLSAESGNEDVVSQAPADDHGTRMAGVLAARHGGGAGSMAGLAPGCEFVSLWSGDTAELWSSNQVARAIWIASGDATARGKRGVLCLAADTSLLTLSPVPDALDPAVNTAVSGLVIVAPTGRDGTPIYPSASLPGNLVICGATDKTNLGDEATTPRERRRFDEWKADGAGADEGSRSGADVSVVAPGVGIITTTTGSGYVTDAQGTSIAAAHVAGLAALVRSKDATLDTGAKVRTRLETTAAKTGRTLYRHVDGRGLRNDEMGFGRIDAAAVLAADAAEIADVYIRDNQTDAGVEPSMGWWVSDVIVTTTPQVPGDATTEFPQQVAEGAALDAAFTAAVAAGAANAQVQANVANYVFIRVRNRNDVPSGDARGLRVTGVLASCATSFFPDDWDAVADDADHVVAALATPWEGYWYEPVPSGQVVIFRLTVEAARADRFDDPAASFHGHACCLARVVACNDVAFNTASLVGYPGDVRTQRNNLTQRNLTVV
jgi:subtilisin family serine protease